MASAADIQAMLRFLSQQANVPLPVAMSKVKPLQSKDLITPSQISASNLATLKEIFEDEKVAKQVLNAAKRASKKRAAGEDPTTSPTSKKRRAAAEEPLTPADIERSLELPYSNLEVNELGGIVLYSNRAPLVLAFAVSLLKHTMPEQPLSSRLSLAQAVVSANSRSKAVSIGLESGKSADEEGWGEGQPTVKVMTREIRVMKRWGYEWKEPTEQDGSNDAKAVDTQSTMQSDNPALWGLDLEAYKKARSSGANGNSTTLPVFTAQSARSYLLRSFDSPSLPELDKNSSGKSKSASAKAAGKERNLGALLWALDLLYGSWADTLDVDELNRRAWGWYIRVRPDVEQGVAGWGGKGNIKLSEILDLRRK